MKLELNAIESLAFPFLSPNLEATQDSCVKSRLVGINAPPPKHLCLLFVFASKRKTFILCLWRNPLFHFRHMLVKASFFKCATKGCQRTLEVKVRNNVGKVLDSVIVKALKLFLNLIESLLIKYIRSSTSKLPYTAI